MQGVYMYFDMFQATKIQLSTDCIKGDIQIDEKFLKWCVTCMQHSKFSNGTHKENSPIFVLKLLFELHNADCR